MFEFTSVHLCQKPNTKMDKLGRFGLSTVRSLLRKRPSLFDVSFLMYMLGTVCSQHKHRSQIQHWVLSVICVHDLISFKFDFKYFISSKPGTLIMFSNRCHGFYYFDAEW